MLSEKGSLKETPPIKLLLTVFEQGLTGILYLKKEDILKVLYFSRGKLIWAISNSEDDKFENILLQKNIIDLPTIQKIKKEAHVSESIGKLLVEKGLITLEELVDSSKEQLKRIIYDVLKWVDGGFQFMKDNPPERLISLDLNITDFIINFIVESMEVSDIWKTIGSLQIELIKNPDEEKLTRYQLSDRQMEILNSFDGENRLESILSRHSGGHRESLLKIIYFFLMSELLIKKEFELSDLSAFEAEKEYNFFGDPMDSEGYNNKRNSNQSRKSNKYDDMNFDDLPDLETMSGMDSKSYFLGNDKDVFNNLSKKNASKELPVEERRPKTTRERREQTFDDVYDFPDPPKNFKSKRVDVPFQQEKKKSKSLALALLLVLIALVMAGIILMVIPWFETEPPPGIMKSSEKSAADSIDIIKIDDNKAASPETQTPTQTPTQIPENTKTDGAGTTPAADTTAGNTNSSKPGENTVKTADNKNSKDVKSSASVSPTQTPPTTPGDTKAQEKANPATAQVPSGKAAENYFKEGNLITAGDVWKKELQKAGIKYSILIELDCKKETVYQTYNQLEKHKKDFFILNRESGNRICYLVLIGKFTNRQDAVNALKTLPRSYWKMKDPPEVVEIPK